MNGECICILFNDYNYCMVYFFVVIFSATVQFPN